MTSWSPILLPNNEVTSLAWEAITAIAHSMLDLRRPDRNHGQRPLHYDQAILYGYLGLALDEPVWVERAEECLAAVGERASEFGRKLSLYGGLSGLGWTMEHLAHVLMDDGDSAVLPVGADTGEDPNGDIDAALLRDLQRPRWPQDYDLIGGLVGIGAYWLERWPRETALRGIVSVIDNLENAAEHKDGGITWRSDSRHFPEWQRRRYPDIYYNLGVAHGIPGIIHFLSEAWAAGVDRDRAKRLLDGTMHWFLKQQLPRSSPSRFSNWVAPGEESKENRLSWCYGDLGILAIMLQVSRRTGQREWQAFTYDLLEGCLTRSTNYAQVKDAALCHGALGVAHIFNRIYQTEGDPRCLNAALRWIEVGLAMRQPGKGVGGFFAHRIPDPSAGPVLDPDPALLDGAGGVALGLLAAVTPIEPAWDRILLLSR